MTESTLFCLIFAVLWKSIFLDLPSFFKSELLIEADRAFKGFNLRRRRTNQQDHVVKADYKNRDIVHFYRMIIFQSLTKEYNTNLI